MFCMTTGCEFSIKLSNSASNFLMSSTEISSVKPLIADQMISTCFSTSIGWYCGCFKISVSRWPQAQLARGQRLTEILKQPQYQPMDVEKQVLIIWSAINGFTDNVAIEEFRRFETELQSFI